MELEQNDCAYNCEIKLRENPRRRKDKVVIGCGAGFGGDRAFAAVKLLQRVEGLDYLVLECLAERTLADRYQVMASGGDGYDSRISEWMSLLLPLSVEKGTCIITNMGAMDPIGAQKNVINIATDLGLRLTVAVAYEVLPTKSGSRFSESLEDGASTYLGAAPIVQCLEKYQPNVIITSRVADAALFLGPMIVMQLVCEIPQISNQALAWDFMLKVREPGVWEEVKCGLSELSLMDLNQYLWKWTKIKLNQEKSTLGPPF